MNETIIVSSISNDTLIDVVITTGPNLITTLTQGPEITTQVFGGGRGKSTYELWLDAGNIGSETDFLESLQGPIGPPGEFTQEQITQAVDTWFGTPGNLDDAIADKHYIHNQQVSQLEWTITHNLGKVPSVLVLDSFDFEMIGDIKIIDNNTITITFTVPIFGKAYLN